MARARLDVKVRLIWRDERAMGPGKADLLDQIILAGSISGAAKTMKMSYSRAWSLVEVMNCAFKSPLVEAAPGGVRGGGAVVTELGLHVLSAYRAMQQAVEREAVAHLPAFQKLLK